jgi:hypothetical protein
MKKFLIISIFLLAMVGCKQSSLSGLVPAVGTVTHDGKTVGNATIVFIPANNTEGMRSASGTTDTNGKFTMTTLVPNDGVFPGEYVVTIDKVESIGEYKVDEKHKVTDTTQIINHLPLKYGNAETSGLTVSISPSGDKKLLFELTGEVDLTPKNADTKPR